MTSLTTETREVRSRYLALLDDMGLVEEPVASMGESPSGAPEFHDDSLVIFEGAMRELRHPLLIPAVVGTVGVMLAGLRSLIGRN